MEDVYVPKELIDAIKKKECILFVASGLTSQVKRSNGVVLPNWPGFLEELLNWAKVKRVPFNSDPNEILEMIHKGNHLMAAEELQELINIADFGEFLNDIFRDPNVKPTTLHQLLTKIPFRAILTTNYDALLEGAYTLSSGGQVPKCFTPLDLSTNISPLRKKDFFIFKMHGDINRPSSIVLGTRSYNNLIYRSPDYVSFLETLFTTYTVLFVGFGGADPDLDYLLDRLSSIFSRTLSKHYILISKGKFNFTERRRLLLDRRLDVIEYDPIDNHKNVSVFINKINENIQGEEIKRKANKNDADEDLTKYIFIISDSMSSPLENKLIHDLDSIDGYHVTAWESLRGYFNEFALEKYVDSIDDDMFDDDSDYKPSIAILVLTEKSLKSVSFELEIEQAILKELDDKISIIPVIIGNIDIPFKLRNYQIVRMSTDYSNYEFDELKKLIKILTSNT